MGLRLGIAAIFLIWVRLGSRHFPKPIQDRQSALSPTIILTINHHLTTRSNSAAAAATAARCVGRRY
ncbi:hypothetical protein NEOLEDRAFT_1127080 [Neolentinus lepideus HHB14362 ss-1]|uniref:Secreted protein n=1 Tax=Neolentinus lepideus HHB14362 ss-1 TaxID=1314782 RepID=A0A165VTZ7_9AGAM|nr:hypothetical protein NEOLEDRAFT_1127080 [Neolentinus lepideus HHB14362 ss-1]